MNRSIAPKPGLRYIGDDASGIRRRRCGRGFTYIDANGQRVRDAATLSRIRALAVPPAWSEVWICADARGHLQATGRDAKGRKQYRYHPRWSETRNLTKFHRLLDFGYALPTLRARVRRDLRRPALDERRVCALAMRLLEDTLVRVGNEEYARGNGSYGLTTLRSEHARINGTCVRLRFRGKGGKLHSVRDCDRRLARILRRCQDLPGQELFQYYDEGGALTALQSEQLNDYLHATMGDQFTAKDFRTWGGTVSAVERLAARARAGSRPSARAFTQTVKEVAELLGNTPSISRRYYIHPAVEAAYKAGTLLEDIRCGQRRLRRAAGRLRAAEREALAFLHCSETPPR